MYEGSSERSLSDSILKTLIYYDIFSYPLTPDEVFQFLPTNGVTKEDVNKELISLTRQSVIFNSGRFYSIQNNPALSTRRQKGNALAMHKMDKARQRARLIGRFPFIRSVMISGSLSKGFMDEKSDIDFFIVTEAGRLWIARTLLVAFKRVFLRNSHKYFCVNYFIDSMHLEIEEKNIFTATELATLIPMVNAEIYKDLVSCNRWLKSFFPNYSARSTAGISDYKETTLKRFLESILNSFSGKRLEEYFKAMTYNRWKKLHQKNLPASDFDIAFKTNDHTSKGHPQNFQRKVIELYQRKIANFPSLKETTGV
jgi:hypothetical protein